MIKLTRVRLINWHYFVNTTANIENITFLTGSNGTGKSTVIDALQIVLLGDTTGHNFNKAANERTGRTLRGYLRCETGEDSDGKVVALRNGRFTSYIACQFYDSVKETDFTLGIVFDCYADGKDERHFFWIDSAFPENNFTNKDLLDSKTPRPLTYRELEEYLSSSFTRSQYRFFETNEQYRQFLKQVLGNLPDKYFTLFKKSVSFVPISDISQFITEFVCDVEHRVDIEPMRKNIEQYRILQLQSNRIKERIDQLKAIQAAYDQYTGLKKSTLALTYVAARADYDYARREVDNTNLTLKKLRESLTSISQQISQIDDQYKELSQERESWVAKKVGSAGYSLSSDLARKKEGYEQKIASLKIQAQNIVGKVSQYCADFESAARGCTAALKDVNLDSMDLDDRQKDLFSSFISFSVEVANECAQTIADCKAGFLDPRGLENLQKDLDSYRSKGAALYAEVDQLIYRVSRTRDELSQQLKSMGSGGKPLPQAYRYCLKEFTEALKSRHPDAQVRMFGDCIDINDPQWITAIEACLGNTRQNLFVDPEYYTEAYKILSEITRRYDYYAINIIDSERVIEFMEDHPADPSSCASLIDAQSEEARAYADYLLGRIRKCYSFEEARASGSGLLSDCTGYRNFTTWYLRRPNYLLVGTRVNASSAQSVHDSFSKADREVSIFNAIKDRLYPLTVQGTMSANEATTYRDDLIAVEQIPDLEANVKRLSDQMKEGNLKDVSAIEEKIRAIDSDLADLSADREKLIEEKGGNQRDIQRLTTEVLPQKEQDLERFRQELEKFTPQEAQDYSKEYDNLFSQMNLDQIKVEAGKRYHRFVERQKSLKDQLLTLRNRYVTTYNQSYDVTQEDTNEPYSSELDQLSNVLLPQYTQQIEEAHDSAVKEFKDDFVYKLRTMIETVQGQIQELNDALVDVRFGRDKYRFTVTPNKDLINYYNMIMDPLLLSAGDADIFMEKYGNEMNELFSLISDEGDASPQDKERIQANIERFTDYTTYLNFDLLVKRGEGPNAVESSLARSFKRQSGGETQTPFYISILASFAQLYRCSQDADTFRLVIFDEAFSKMDVERIRESVGLLRSFGLQVIISTPPEKLGDLARLVDESLVTFHDEKRRLSYLDLWQDTTRKIGEIKATDLKPHKPAAAAPEAQAEQPEQKDQVQAE